MNRYLARIVCEKLRFLTISLCLLGLNLESTASAQYFRGGPLGGVSISRGIGPAYLPAIRPPMPPIARYRPSAVFVAPIPVPGAVLQRRAYSYPYAAYPYSVYASPQSSYRAGYAMSPFGGFSLRIDTAPVYGAGYDRHSYGVSSYGAYSIPVPVPSYSLPSDSAGRSIYDGTIRVAPQQNDEFGPGRFGPSSDMTNSIAPIPNTMNAGDAAENLHAAARRLQKSLSDRGEDAEVWMDYLAPAEIIDRLYNGGKLDVLRKMLLNYDGVAANPDLDAIANADGFAETRKWLRALAGEPAADLGESVIDQEPSSTPQMQLKPAVESEFPQPLPVPTPLPEPDQETGQSAATGPTPAAPITPADGGDSE